MLLKRVIQFQFMIYQNVMLRHLIEQNNHSIEQFINAAFKFADAF